MTGTGTMPGSLEEYFDGRPESFEIFNIVSERVDAIGPSTMTIGSQISFGRSRKFLWFWLYNVTQKNPNGVPHLMLALDHVVESARVRDVNQISKHRWNHQIVVRKTDDARSGWLGDLIGLAYEYGGA